MLQIYMISIGERTQLVQAHLLSPASNATIASCALYQGIEFHVFFSIK